MTVLGTPAALAAAVAFFIGFPFQNRVRKCGISQQTACQIHRINQVVFQQISHLLRCSDSVYKGHRNPSLKVLMEGHAQRSNPIVRQMLIMRDLTDILYPV